MSSAPEAESAGKQIEMDEVHLERGSQTHYKGKSS